MKLNAVLLLISTILTVSCSPEKKTTREELEYYDSEKTVIRSKKTYCDSISPEGDFSSFRHGEHIYYNENGNIKAYSNYKYDILDSLCYSINEQNDTNSLSFYINGARHGRCIWSEAYDREKATRTTCNYLNNLLDGDYLEEFVPTSGYLRGFMPTIGKNYLKMKGQYSKGQRVGIWLENDSEKGLSLQFDGYSTYTYQGTNTYRCKFMSGWEGMVVNGQMDGEWINSKNPSLAASFSNGELLSKFLEGRNNPTHYATAIAFGKLDWVYGQLLERMEIMEGSQFDSQKIALDFQQGVRKIRLWNSQEGGETDYSPKGNKPIGNLMKVEKEIGKYIYEKKYGNKKKYSLLVDFRHNVIIEMTTKPLSWSEQGKLRELKDSDGYTRNLTYLTRAVDELNEFSITDIQLEESYYEY